MPDGFVTWGAGDETLTPALDQALYLLTGLGDRTVWPLRRFQPSAIPDVLERVSVLVCLHQDKHGLALACYGRGLGGMLPRLAALAEERGVLAVRFGIPPMLARWDRALFDMRLAWEREGRGPFPVPAARSSVAREIVPDGYPLETSSGEE